MQKLRLAVHWASSCGGCDIALVELGEHLVELAQVADIVFWPCATDHKYAEVEAMEDNSIDLTLFNGAIRTDHDRHMAHLLRAKSRILVAFGSCATEGCIPSLSNIRGAAYALQRATADELSTVNPKGIIPCTDYQAPEGSLPLPALETRVRALNQIVPVDYGVPGCPPNHDQVWKAISQIVSGNLPTRGSTLGADPRTVCDQCPRKRTGKIRVSRFLRVHEGEPDPDICLLEQGYICAGPATRAGCGALCIGANMPCRGCYGPPEGVLDQGAALLSAVVAGLEGRSDAEIRAVLDTIADPVGTFYRFSLAGSILHTLGSEDGDTLAQSCSVRPEEQP
ncbi:MAG: oxidoreductase [Anaerolineae bacterium]